MRHLGTLLLVGLGLLAVTPASAQPLPRSGTLGIDLVWATAPGGSSQLYAVTRVPQPGLVPIGSSVAVPPSRWSHRRRTLGALETGMVYLEDGLVLTPMGNAVGNGGLHVLDVRVGVTATLLPTGNPAAYDVAVSESTQCVFTAEDDGAGQTTLRGWSYQVPGMVTPLDPPSLALPGSPVAGVNRMGVSADGTTLHVPTTQGVQVVTIATTIPHVAVANTIATPTHQVVTNPARFVHQGVETWAAGTTSYDGSGTPIEAGYLLWTAAGDDETGVFGIILGLSPPRPYVPAAGTTELAVVSDGTDSYAYLLLRDPSPTAFFIRPSGVGVARKLGSAAAETGVIIYPPEGGEPFAIPTVSGTRVAIESSQGPPFNTAPADGGEPLAILYSPLDPLGAGTLYGHLAVPSPLGGRISTKGMDRPLWSRDGTRVVGSTSHFPGAPNPGVPGLEVMNVPETVAVTFYNPPQTVVPIAESPDRTIIFPSSFDPRDPSAAAFLDGLTFVGSVFHDGVASVMLAPFGAIGQFQARLPKFVQSADIPNFPAIMPPTFQDAAGSVVPVPPAFGARRTSWNLLPGAGFQGLTMVASVGEEVLIQASGINFLAELGLFPGGSIPPLSSSLPSGWITSSEFVSL